MPTMLQLDMPHDAVHTCMTEDIDDDHPAEGRETSIVILVHEQPCTCWRWQDHKYPCHHAMAYLHKWRNLTFSEILTNHAHQYYKMTSMKEIYKYNMNPAVWDSIRFDGITKPAEVQTPAGCPKKKRIRKRSTFLSSD